MCTYGGTLTVIAATHKAPAAPHASPEGRYVRAERALWERHGVAVRNRLVNVEALGTTVRVQETGSGDPVLFIHGGPNAGSTFAPMVAAMPGVRSLVLDRPGCGLSAAVEHSRLPLRRLAPTVLASTLDGLGVDRVDVVASSFGGAWSLWFALAHPERVRRLVLLGAPAFVPGMLVPGFMRALCTPVLGHLIAAMPPNLSGSRWIHRQMGHGAEVVESGISPEYWAWGIRLMADTPTMANDVRIIRQVVARGQVRPEVQFTPADLRALAVPTLLYWGTDDTFGGSELARSTAALIPGSTLELLPGGGHLPWLDDPARAARSALTFLHG